MEARKFKVSDEVLEGLTRKYNAIWKEQNFKQKKQEMPTILPHIYGLRQIESNPPIFELVVKKKENVPKAAGHVILNDIRSMYPFKGTPVIFKVRSIEE